MHNFSTERTSFNYNSDLSGDVIIFKQDGSILPFEVPGEDLLAFVAEWIRLQKISKIEKLTQAEILGIE